MIIESTGSLDVTGLYTTATLRRNKCCGTMELGAHRSIDVEQLAEREIERKPDDRLPHLVPQAPFPPPPDAPATLVQFRNPTSGPVGSVTLNTNPLTPTQVQSFDIAIPDGRYGSGGQGCLFDITVDSPPPSVTDSDETNNTDSSGCPGLVP